MDSLNFTLNHLPIGKRAKVIEINNNTNMKRRLLDLGFTVGAKVETLQKSPGGDPIAYLIRGAVIALRSEDSSTIRVKV